MTLVSTVFFGILGLGIIVFVHELGHFLAAKAGGIEVEVFSLGWGRRLAGFRRGATLYQVAVFPLGGYCKMKGEMLRGDMSEEKMAALRSEPGSFLAASPWRRILVAVAGPAANFVVCRPRAHSHLVARLPDPLDRGTHRAGLGV